MWRVFGVYVRTGSIALAVFEVCVLNGAFASIYYLIRYPDYSFLLPPALATVMWIVMFSLGIYETSCRVNLAVFARRLMFSCAIGGLILAVIQTMAGVEQNYDSSRPQLLAIWLVLGSFCFILLSRLLLRVTTVSTGLRPRILVLGTGQVAAALRDLIEGQPGNALSLQGYCAEAREPSGAGGPAGPIAAPGIPAASVVVAPENLVEYAITHSISEIVVALDERRGQFPTAQLLDCKFQGVRITEVSTFIERETGRVSLDSLYPSWLIFADGFRGGRRRTVIKRLFDILVSSLLLLLVAPALCLIIPLIKLDSPGPIFYRQTRVGLTGRPFEVFKFRSMRIDAEGDGKPRWASGADDRVTRVGKFMRKTRIDEIPQIINVLRGDMSFVGPRPERPFFVEKLALVIPYYHERHRVKPGITGWSQINFPYGASIADAREKLKYDLYYMKNYSIFLDMVIILKTCRVVMFSEGAR